MGRRDTEIDDIWQRLLQRTRRDSTPHRQLGPASLDPLRRLLARLGNPQDRLSSIHVAGSKGKSSTARYLEALLRAGGQRTGLFTSPHVEHWRERFRVAAVNVEPHLLDIDRALQQALAPLDAADAPRFFDCLTALALCLFERCDCDWAILETGIGGRVDATNIIAPRLCILTGVELEHVDRLGPTLADIAREKAGIVKADVPLVCAQLPEPVTGIVTERASSLTAPLLRLGRDFDVQPINGRAWRYSGKGVVEFELAASSDAQAGNAALALAACEALGLEPADAATALADVHLAARCEVLCTRPRIVLDSAHTPASAELLREFLGDAPTVNLVVSMSSDRNLTALAAILGVVAHRVIVTCADPQWSLPATTLAAAFRDTHAALEVIVVERLEAALEHALSLTASDQTLCITGSTYLAGAARVYLRGRLTTTG